MNLTLDPATGFYDLPLVAGAPIAYCSPGGSDANPGTQVLPVATLGAARKKLPKGKPGAILLLAGGRWVDQQLWVDGGAGPDAPQVVATYGGTERAVIDCSSPVPGESALQVRGPAFLSDIEFVCEPGRSGCVARGPFELVAQNVLVRDAGMGWDLSETIATLHRSLVLDCYDPKGDRSQGLFNTTAGRTRLSQSVFHRCGWKPGVPLTFYASDKNHCVYIHQSAGVTNVEECFFGEPGSHGTQLRGGGTVARSVYYRCPIGGFAQNTVGIIDDSYFEQQDATQLGQGSCPTGEHRGWGWDLEATHAECNRCGFHRGGGPHPTARALHVSRVNPERTPPRTSQSVYATAVRIAGWAGGLMVSAPPSEVATVDVEVDQPAPRWLGHTVDPFVETLRGLGRGSDWGLIARLAADGYASLEQVTNKGAVKRVNEAVASTLVEQAAVLRKAVE